jgi:hypothetical protein
MIRRPNIKPPPPINKDISSLRAYVRVDPSPSSQGGVGFVTAVHTEERKVDVNYIENSIGIINSSPFTTETRLHSQSFDLLGVGGGGGDGTTRSGRCIKFREGAATAVVTPPPFWKRYTDKEE